MPKRELCIKKRTDSYQIRRYRNYSKENRAVNCSSFHGKLHFEEKYPLKRIYAKPVMPRKTTKTFGEILKLWLQTNRVKYKASTFSKYAYMINSHIKPQLGSIQISQITASDINTFLDEQLRHGKIYSSAELSPSYVRSMMLIIQSAINFAVSEGYCRPLKSTINKPQIIKEDVKILSGNDFYRLSSYLLGNRGLTELGVLISLYMGLRIGEVCALSWNDINLNEKILRVRKTAVRINDDNGSRWYLDFPKTPSSCRDIPIPSVIYNNLKEAFAQRESEYVISDCDRFVNPRTYEYRYHRILSECGIPTTKYHTLRHTFATNALQSGMDIKTLSEILGHKDSSITLATYVHSSIEAKRMQMEQVRCKTA